MLRRQAGYPSQAASPIDESGRMPVAGADSVTVPPTFVKRFMIKSHHQRFADVVAHFT
jgi:hypothetical protein